MSPVTLAQTAIGISSLVPMDLYGTPFNVGVASKLSAGTVTYTIQYTMDNPYTATDASGTNLTWFDHPTMAGLTGNAYGNFAFPVRAIRSNVAAIAGGGTLTTTIVQAVSVA